MPSRRFTTSVALLLSLFALSFSARAQTRRALLIGIDQYSVPEGKVGAKEGRRTWRDLHGCVNDAEAMASLLETRYGFKHENIELLEDRAAEREVILSRIRARLIDPAKDGDISVLYYAGHGSQMTDTSHPPTNIAQTIVPADSWKGVYDIPDKQISELLNAARDKGAVVTAIFDSCHSNAVTRGFKRLEGRFAAPDERDAAPLPPHKRPDPPELRGVLTFAAALEDQFAAEVLDAEGVAHGLFTKALIDTLNETPNAPAAEIKRRVRMIIESEARDQEPALSGKDRDTQPIFGGSVVADERLLVVVRPSGPKMYYVDGGRALGLIEGCELVQARKVAKPARLGITTLQGVTRSKATLIDGDAATVRAGDVFFVDKWAQRSDALRVAWQSDGPTAEQIAAAVKAIDSIHAPEFTLVDDPTLRAPDYVVKWDADQWVMTAAVSGRTTPLGTELSADVIRNNAARASSVFIDVPVSRELAAALDPWPRGVAVRRVNDIAGAHYLLEGRVKNGVVEYAWVVPNRTKAELEHAPLPVRTDWIAVTKGLPDESGGCTSSCTVSDLDRQIAAKDPSQATVKRLHDYAGTLARMRAWHELKSPSENRFPFHIVLRSEGRDVRDGVVTEGESYTPVLVPDPTFKDIPQQRFVYVFSIESHGTANLLYPTTAIEKSNKLPKEKAGTAIGTLEEIPLDSAAFDVTCPYGVDTYVMLTTQDPIEQASSIFNWCGVLRGEPKGAMTPLAGLLEGVGARGNDRPVPTSWSIEKLTVTTKEAH